jgi:RNA polymerase sigma-70 factor, ECF subfamily
MNADNDNAVQLASALAGDPESFAGLIGPYRNELLAHCYRILGSFQDAEDILQETLVRAWRHLDSLEGRSSLRAWLYKIATNACLDALDSRKSRGLPAELYARGDPSRPLPQPAREIIWVEAFPDTFIDQQPAVYPEARVEVRESVTLAFVAALQKLPGRQRAVLLLRDVMGWDASETARILDMSTAAVNSALQRARATLKQAPARPERTSPAALDEQLSSLLGRYVAAWESADSAALVATLREDVRLTMPPFPVWFAGQRDIQAFLDGTLFRSADPFRVRLVPAHANGSPAFAVYQRDVSGVYRAAALHILEIDHTAICEIHDFLTFDGQLFSRFGLPLTV